MTRTRVEKKVYNYNFTADEKSAFFGMLKRTKANKDIKEWFKKRYYDGRYELCVVYR